MTWEQLKAHIEVMDKEQLQTDVTVYSDYADEFEPVIEFDYVSKDGNGILDPFHPFLIIQG
ncbi:MAG: hypothetical protein J7L15_08305 [Clostridiales bacterium]|nr:hypothetical protein [Clostridiales bacterium]